MRSLRLWRLRKSALLPDLSKNVLWIQEGLCGQSIA